MTILSALVLAGAATMAQEDGETLPSTVSAVTVHPSGASVVRAALAPEGDRRIVVAGLPASIDTATVRVRADGAEVVGVETRQRVDRRAPDDRIEALRAEVQAAERALRILRDEGQVLDAAQGYLVALRRGGDEDGVDQGQPVALEARLSSWDAELAWLEDKTVDVRLARVAHEQDLEAAQGALLDAQRRLGAARNGGAVPVVDVIVDLADLDGGGAGLELEYFVPGAAWVPMYELRADRSLEQVELIFRARVNQHTGEDWNAARLTLSTAEPRRGAAGPAPKGQWLTLSNLGREDYSQLRALGYSGDDATLPTTRGIDLSDAAKTGEVTALIEAQGTSVRYRLPREETVESRTEPTSVFVGRARLSAAPERICIPAQDETVWLRSKARNTSPWTLLSGEAAVFFGADYLGTSTLDAVQPGAEIMLHLGPDPGFEVERIKLSEETDGPGIFGSRSTRTTSWRFRVKNHGALSSRSDGSATVFLQEPLQRSRDSRVDVEVDEALPAVSTAARWQQLRDERGILTWSLSVPRGQERRVELTVDVKYPTSLRLIGD